MPRSCVCNGLSKVYKDILDDAHPPYMRGAHYEPHRYAPKEAALMQPAFIPSATMLPRPLYFRAPMLSPLSPRTWAYIPDGLMIVSRGHIVAVGPMDMRHIPAPPTEIQELDGVIVPGFVDIHIHWVQHAVRGRFEAQLMPWLRDHIWPEEVRYSDQLFAANQAHRFFHDLLRAGTVMGMAYSSPHIDATLTAFRAMRGDWMIGNAIMEMGGPPELIGASAKSAEGLVCVHRMLGRRHYVVTPRFAINCTQEGLADFGQFAQKERLFVQTHLAESVAEVAEVKALFPDAQDYTDVYDRAGLLTPRTVLGHCIHLHEREWQVLSARGSVIAHCPSSNEVLDSGCMDLEQVRAHGLRYALASDVGAGPSVSMLHVIQRFLEVHHKNNTWVSPEEALYRATLAGAEAMGRAHEAGNFRVGKRADFVLLPSLTSPASPQSWLREITTGSPRELETRPLGTWIAGERVA